MRSNYKRIGDYIRKVDNRNTDLTVTDLRGLSMTKEFRKSTSNTVGTDMSKYKIVKRSQFACDFMSVIRVFKLPVVLHKEDNPVIVSPAYTVFEIEDETKLLPDYLMMWMRRPEFDRYADFKCDSAIRGGFAWDELCDVELPVPSIEKQREIVKEYQTVVDRIHLNEQLNQKLEETAQAIYRHWFVDVETENMVSLGDMVEFNPKHSIKKGALTTYIEMSNVREDSLNVSNSVVREFTAGSKFQNDDTLLARITPCLENGKTAFVNCLKNGEVGYGSTEFIVMRSKRGVSPFWTYCTAREENFRSYAISSMVGSSGRQRVHSDYLEVYTVKECDTETMERFHTAAGSFFRKIKTLTDETVLLGQLRENILSGLATKI